MRAVEQRRRAMARISLSLLAHWRVPDKQARDILGGIDAVTYARWKAGVFTPLSARIEARFGLLIGIQLGLRLMFRDRRRAYAWMSRPNRLFANQTPITLIGRGDVESLQRLRDYLLAETQPW